MDGRRVDAGPVLRTLRARARAMAEAAYGRRGGGGGDIRKRTRNRSAYVSRHAARHYEHLLAEHVQRVEDERDAQAAAYQAEVDAVAQLRTVAQRLTDLLREHERDGDRDVDVQQ